MNTVIKDWIIVSVLDGDNLMGEVLYGTVIDDMTCRFATGSLYKILGKGRRAIIDVDDFELLRNGFSPEYIKALNQPSLLVH
jgi:hypothetical protein